MKNNLEEIILKLKPKEESAPVYPLSIAKRRLISSGLGQRRKFAGVITGQDIRSPVSSDDFSGVVNLGQDLPSFAELAQREEAAERQKEFLKNKDKFPLPKKRDRRAKI